MAEVIIGTRKERLANDRRLLNDDQLTFVLEWRNTMYAGYPGEEPTYLTGLNRVIGARFSRYSLSYDDAFKNVMPTVALSEGLRKRDSGALPTDVDVCHRYCVLVAGVISHVSDDTDDGRSLASCVTVQPKWDKTVPLMPEERFINFLDQTSIDRIYIEARRAVGYAANQVDVLVLADDLFALLMQLDDPRSCERKGNVKERWMRDYYAKNKAVHEALGPKSKSAGSGAPL